MDPKDTLCSWQSGTLSVAEIPGGSYLWTPGNYTTSAITIDTAVAGGIGTTRFRVIVTNSEGCSGTDSLDVTFKECTGIDDPANRFTYSVSPNPSNGEFDLRIHAPTRELVTWRIRSSGGQINLEEKDVIVFGSYIRHLDIRHLASGVYLLEIERETGIVSKKIIKL